ncbi:MAG: hypothetical protein M0034_01525 [Deltaproteobacteria bacterium]|nr:hypothetical protein [Deltaproteobacteria bacterium]
MLNLYNPQNFSSLFSVLTTAFLLGIVHGFTPDEHTWPITFSYSIGSYSTKGGFKTGLLFSLAFTFQRAVASELSYYALGKILTKPDVVPIIYIFVGIVMSFAGAYVIGLGENFELFEGLEKILLKFLKIKTLEPQTKYAGNKSHPIPLYMVLLHGFIAGWGTGAFAIIVYTVLAPKMPNGYIGFLPGLLFGLGTMATQIIIGMFAGRFMERLKIPKKGIEYIARRTSGLTLFWGGLAFVLAAALEIAFPKLIQAGFITPVKVHNLHTLGVGFFLVIFIILFILATSFIKSLKYVKNNGSEFL